MEFPALIGLHYELREREKKLSEFVEIDKKKFLAFFSSCAIDCFVLNCELFF